MLLAPLQVPAYTQSYFYVFYEQFSSIVSQYLAMLSLTVVAIFIVTFIFMGPKTALVVSFLVLMIHVDMLVSTALPFLDRPSPTCYRPRTLLPPRPAQSLNLLVPLSEGPTGF